MFTKTKKENEYLINDSEKTCNLNEIKNTGDIIILFYSLNFTGIDSKSNLHNSFSLFNN